MKALTIKQPWASLIALGIKDVENRTWKTSYRGRIYIHSSSKPAKYNFTEDQSSKLAPVGHGTFYLSAIIGEVDIVDCVINHPSIWAEQNKTYRCEETGINILVPHQKLIYNWVLANPVLYKEPILNVKGALSFWEWKGEKP